MTLPPPEVCQQIFASWVLLGAPDWTEADRIRLFGLLAKHSLSINDLPQVFLSVGVAAAPSRPKDKIYERLWRLFGQLAADNDSIRTTAREKLNAFLSKHKLGWNGPNGFTAILLSYDPEMPTIPRLLEAAWAHAFPGREAAERNAVLRELSQLQQQPRGAGAMLYRR
jgi:hypothetical protein